MTGSMNGKIAIITGGSKGIGAAAARKFVQEGARVMINYNSDSSAAEKLVSELGGSDVAASIQADAGSIEGVQKIVDATVSKYGQIDIVVANAGLLLMRDLMSTTPEDFQICFNTNVQGPYFLAQKAVPHMKSPDGGRIIFLSTSVNKNSSVAPNYLLYSSTKGAIEQMTRIMSKELGPRKITVNAVAPGPTSTELFLKGKSPELVKTIEGWHPQKRIGQPEEIANALAFVAGDGARWVSGQTILVNGASIV